MNQKVTTVNESKEEPVENGRVLMTSSQLIQQVASFGTSPSPLNVSIVYFFAK